MPAINCSSWSDRFSGTWTFLLLLVLAVITGIRHSIGPNATCWSPSSFTKSMTTYTDNICWLSREIIVDDKFIDSDVPYVRAENPYEANPVKTRTLYQWLPLILAFQALFFRIPDIVLQVLESSFGFGSSKVSNMVTKYDTMASSDKITFAKNLSQYLNQTFKSRPLKFLPIGTVTIILVFVKLLIFINAVTQLSLLEGYLSPPNITSYGEFVVNSIISNNYTDIAVSPVFPRKVLCDMAIRQLSTVQRFTMVCLLPVNEFNEQVCFFIWIWLLVVCVASATSGVIFLIKSLIPKFRQRFVSKYLQMGDAASTPTQLNLFTGTDIGQDGVLLLQMIGYVSSEILVRDIILNIWYIHHIKNEPGQTPYAKGGYVFAEKTPEVDNDQSNAPEMIEMGNPLLKHT